MNEVTFFCKYFSLNNINIFLVLKSNYIKNIVNSNWKDYKLN